MRRPARMLLSAGSRKRVFDKSETWARVAPIDLLFVVKWRSGWVVVFGGSWF